MADSSGILAQRLAEQAGNARNGASAAATPATRAAEAVQTLMAPKAAPEAPAEPAAPTKPLSPQQRLAAFREKVPTIPVNYNGTVVDVPVEQAFEQLSAGRKRADIEKEKADWKLQKAGYGEFEQLMARARQNPDVLRAVQDLIGGQADPRKLYQAAQPAPAAPQATDDDATPAPTPLLRCDATSAGRSVCSTAGTRSYAPRRRPRPSSSATSRKSPPRLRTWQLLAQ